MQKIPTQRLLAVLTTYPYAYRLLHSFIIHEFTSYIILLDSLLSRWSVVSKFSAEIIDFQANTQGGSATKDEDVCEVCTIHISITFQKSAETISDCRHPNRHRRFIKKDSYLGNAAYCDHTPLAVIFMGMTLSVHLWLLLCQITSTQGMHPYPTINKYPPSSHTKRVDNCTASRVRILFSGAHGTTGIFEDWLAFLSLV